MILQVINISKTCPNGVPAFKDITLTNPNGMYGLLSPKGAGRSARIRTLTTLQEPDKGNVRLSGINVLNQKDEERQIRISLPPEPGVHSKRCNIKTTIPSNIQH